MNSVNDKGLFLRPSITEEELSINTILDRNGDQLQREYEFCDYCGKTFYLNELRVVTDSDTSSRMDANLLGGYIERRTVFFKAKMCKRCRKIHNIVDFIFLVIALVFVGFTIYLRSNYGYPCFEDYIIPVSASILVVYVIYRIVWFFIRIFYGVKGFANKGLL